MKERPILFSGPMVKAILEGRKTQTRRIVKPQPTLVCQGGWADSFELWTYRGLSLDEDIQEVLGLCPYGQAGEKLWLREKMEWSAVGTPSRYAADGCPIMVDGESVAWPFLNKSAPSIHMPREFSRITLEIVSIRPERLQEITDDDAEHEGVDITNASIPGYCRERFHRLWDYLNGKKHPWSSNPFVWRIEFKRL